MDYPCIRCAADVWPRQLAVQCESCLRWHYRVCGTGITQKQYRRANKGIEDISWVCESCSCIVDRANSTAITDISRLTSMEVSVITDDLVEGMVADEARDQTYIIHVTAEPSGSADAANSTAVTDISRLLTCIYFVYGQRHI